MRNVKILSRVDKIQVGHFGSFYGQYIVLPKNETKIWAKQALSLLLARLVFSYDLFTFEYFCPNFSWCQELRDKYMQTLQNYYHKENAGRSKNKKLHWPQQAPVLYNKRVARKPLLKSTIDDGGVKNIFLKLKVNKRWRKWNFKHEQTRREWSQNQKPAHTWNCVSDKFTYSLTD